MKKILLLLCVLLTSVTTFAETNLALTATASASGAEGGYVAANAIDGNAGTRWGSNYEGNTDAAWFQIEWTAAQTFNTVKLLCEGAMNSGNAPELAFNIQTSNDGTTWTTQQSMTGKNADNGEYITVILDASVSAKFVRFQGVKKGNYGYSFYEFEVYDIDYSSQTLTTLVLPNPDKTNASLTAVKVGGNITISALDEHNTAMTSGFSFAATNGTITAAGVFTPSAAGLCTITATQGATVLTASVYAYAGDDLLLNLPGVANPEATNINVFNDGNWDNRSGLGQPADNHTWLYYDLGAYYTIDLVDLKQEQACGKNYTIQFSADGEAWTTAYTVTNEAGMAGDVRHYFYGSDQNTNVRFVRFDCTEPATGYGVSIYEIAAYGTKTADIADTEAPTAFTATLKSVSFTSATLTLQATDNVSAITYTISREGAVDQVVNGASGEEVTATVSGLTPGTAYEFSVVAKDAKDNATAAVTVNATTPAWTSAPAPTRSADDVMSVYSDAYTSSTPDLGFADWGSSTAFSNVAIGEDHALKFDLMNYYGLQFNTQLDVTSMEYLHIDVFALNAGSLGVVPIWWNAAANGNFPEIRKTITLTPGEWASFDIPLSDFADATRGGTNLVHQLKLDNGGDNYLYVDNIYFWKTSATITSLTVEAAASEVRATTKTQLTVKDQASNIISASYVDFESSNTAVATVDADGVVTGVAEGTVTITATLKADATIQNTVQLTITPAPLGQVLTSGTHEVFVQAFHQVGTNNYKLVITSDEDMDGLGGSFWNVNGTGADMRTNAVVSSDRKTITIEVESSSAPNIYTPLYVMMPGEISFGSVTLQWMELVKEGLVVDVEQGQAVVAGAVTSADVTAIATAAGDATSVNLTRATFASAVTMTVANPNAVFIVKETQKTNLGETKNMVVWNADESRYEGDIKITDQNNDNAFATDLTIFATNASYQRTVAADAYVTTALPIGTLIPAGFSAYELQEFDGTTVKFQKVSAATLSKGAPYILHNVSDAAKEFEAAATNEPLTFTATGATFVSNFKAQTLKSDGTTTYYAIGGTGTCKLMKIKDSGAKVGAFRSYLAVPAVSSSALLVLFDEGDGTTSIATIEADGVIRKADAVYDMQGRRVEKATKGVYIVNGKKVVIK